MRETQLWIAAVVCAILIVIGLVIGTVRVITYYKCKKMCPLPCHNCSVDCPLFKLIKCCCKGGFCPSLLIHNNSKQHNGNRLISSWFDILLFILIDAFIHTSMYKLLGLLPKINVFGGLAAHWPLVWDACTVLVSVSPLIWAGFGDCHCTGRWAVRC